MSWTDLLGLQNKKHLQKVVAIALEIAKPAYGIILHSPKPEENIASKKDLDGDKTGSGVFACRLPMMQKGGRLYTTSNVRIT